MRTFPERITWEGKTLSLNVCTFPCMAQGPEHKAMLLVCIGLCECICLSLHAAAAVVTAVTAPIL